MKDKTNLKLISNRPFYLLIACNQFSSLRALTNSISNQIDDPFEEKGLYLRKKQGSSKVESREMESKPTS